MRKILIISLPFNNNYGYLLQNYALQKTVKDLFKEKQKEDVLVQTDYRWNLQKNNPLKKLLLFFYRLFRLYIKKEYVYKNNLWNDDIQKTYIIPLLMKKQRVFVDKYLNMINFIEKMGGGKKSHSNKDLPYDTIIVGSDQVFRPAYAENIRQSYLDFIQDKQVTRVSYATSFGCKDEREYTKKELEACSLLAKKFDAFSVRENSAVDICKRCFSVDALVMPDPTFLLDKKDYERLIKKEETSKYRGKIGYYFLEDNKQNFSLLHSLQQTINLKTERIGQKQKPTPQTKDYTDCIFPSISEFFAGFRDSEYIITDSYHGMIFSIIFHKPFFIIDKKNVNIERVKHLLDIFPLKERFIDSSLQIDKFYSMPIDYETIDKKIEKMQKEGKDFLDKYVVEKDFSK